VKADKYFKQYLTASFHPVDITANVSVHAIYPLVVLNHNSGVAQLNGTRTEDLDENA
jgi:hypothetical protein